jgi:hypothetical protein
MIWKQTTPQQWIAEKYIIERDPNYRYLLSHITEGPIRKYRLLEGAQRAAERHARGERRKANVPRTERPSRGRIETALEFMERKKQLGDWVTINLTDEP